MGVKRVAYDLNRRNMEDRMMKKLIKVLFLFIFIVGCLYLRGGDIQASWKGKKEVRNGITFICNPSQPVRGELNFELEDDLVISYGENENDVFGWITGIELDHDNNVYVMDSKRCVIFKYDNRGKFQYKIGRKGVGPGEFRRPRDFFVSKERDIYVLDEYLIHIFDNRGNFRSQIELNKNAYHFLVNKKNRNIIYSYRSYSGKGKRVLVAVSGYDQKEEKVIADFFNGKKVEIVHDGKLINFHLDHVYTPGFYFRRVSEDACVYAHSSGVTLTKLDQKGMILFQIEKEESPQPILKEEKERLYDWYAPYYEKTWSKKVFRQAMQFPDHRPFFKSLIVDDQGRIYVVRLQSFLKKEADGQEIMDVFDRQGYYIYRVRVPLVPDVIRDGYLYHIKTDNDSGEISIGRSKIKNWPKMK